MVAPESNPEAPLSRCPPFAEGDPNARKGAFLPLTVKHEQFTLPHPHHVGWRTRLRPRVLQRNRRDGRAAPCSTLLGCSLRGRRGQVRPSGACWGKAFPSQAHGHLESNTHRTMARRRHTPDGRGWGGGQGKDPSHHIREGPPSHSSGVGRRGWLYRVPSPSAEMHPHLGWGAGLCIRDGASSPPELLPSPCATQIPRVEPAMPCSITAGLCSTASATKRDSNRPESLGASSTPGRTAPPADRQAE